MENTELGHPAYLVDGWSRDKIVSKMEMEYICQQLKGMNTSTNFEIGASIYAYPQCELVPELEWVETYLKMIADKTESDYRHGKTDLAPEDYPRVHYFGIESSAALETKNIRDIGRAVLEDIRELSDCGIFGFQKHIFMPIRSVGGLEILMFIGVDMRSKEIVYYDDTRLGRPLRSQDKVRQMRGVIDDLADKLRDAWYKAGKMGLWQRIQEVRPLTRLQQLICKT